MTPMHPLIAALAAMLVAGTALAQDDTAVDGQVIYEEHCSFCHQPTGLGDPPEFPALSGNPLIADLNRVVQNIHEGREAMPPFPTLSTDEVAAVATYIRGAWGNSFAPADPEVVASIIDDLGGAAEEISIWDSVFTDAQAKRGATAYRGPCGLCHGRRLDGAPDDADMRPSPPLAHAKFTRNWDGRSLASLYEFTRATMPQSNPGYMDAQTYVDIIAHMLSMTGAPAGDEELTPDRARLATIVIGPKP